MSRIRGPYVRFCERDEAVTPHPTRFVLNQASQFYVLTERGPNADYSGEYGKGKAFLWPLIHLESVYLKWQKMAGRR